MPTLHADPCAALAAVESLQGFAPAPLRSLAIRCRARHAKRRVALAALFACAAAACGGGGGGGSSGSTEGYQQVNLNCAFGGSCDRANFSDGVRNAWGVAVRAGVWAVAGNQRQVTACYDAEGRLIGAVGSASGCGGVILIPLASSSTYAAPTGLVWNDSSEFVIANGSKSGSAALIVATEEGAIAGINRDVDEEFGIVAVDNSARGARYTGLAIGADGKRTLLYAANFHDRVVDVFDGTFTPIDVSGGFADPGIPAGFAPFGIQNLGGEIFVTYAKHDRGAEQDVAGAGNGYVSVFDADGTLLRRFASQGPLNSPWGITRAPDSFGPFRGAIILANHGDGRLNAFDVEGTLLGQLERPDGNPITIDGLWGVAAAEPTESVPAAVYFTAGPRGGEDGLFGRLEPAS